MSWPIVAASAVVLLMLTGVLGTLMWLFSHWMEAQERYRADRKEAGCPLEPRLAALELQVKGLPSLWEEERERARKWMDRARKSEARAEELLEEVEGASEQAEFVLSADGEGGPGPRLHSVPEGVEDGPVLTREAAEARARAAGLDPVTLATMGRR